MKKIKESLEDHFNQEIEMACSELYNAAQDAMKLHSMISKKHELEAWQQSKITKGADYFSTVLRSLSHDAMMGGFDDTQYDIDDESIDEGWPEIKKGLKKGLVGAALAGAALTGAHAGGVSLPGPDGATPPGAHTVASQVKMNNQLTQAVNTKLSFEQGEQGNPVKGTMTTVDGEKISVTAYPPDGMQPRLPYGTEYVKASLNGDIVTVGIYNGKGYIRNFDPGVGLKENKTPKRKFNEGSMGGINRSRPGADVNYSHVLDDPNPNDDNATVRALAMDKQEIEYDERLNEFLSDDSDYNNDYADEE